jgi:hypothetical protein
VDQCSEDRATGCDQSWSCHGKATTRQSADSSGMRSQPQCTAWSAGRRVHRRRTFCPNAPLKHPSKPIVQVFRRDVDCFDRRTGASLGKNLRLRRRPSGLNRGDLYDFEQTNHARLDASYRSTPEKRDLKGAQNVSRSRAGGSPVLESRPPGSERRAQQWASQLHSPIKQSQPKFGSELGLASRQLIL